MNRATTDIDKNIDMQVTRHTRNIEGHPPHPQLIQTNRNKGNEFAPEVIGSAE
jgi:hypothetical protein